MDATRPCWSEAFRKRDERKGQTVELKNKFRSETQGASYA